MLAMVSPCMRLQGLVSLLLWTQCCYSFPSATPGPTPLTLDAKQLGEACEEDAQCSLLDRNVICQNKFCACASGFYLPHDTNGSLCDPDGGTFARSGGTHLDTNMIIVIVALAVMFLGICVALHLFSRARFRNRRTIFNSPHPRLMHIKLGRKKKKSSTPLSGSQRQMQQHLSTPIHHAAPRHHSFSGHHSPLPIARVPKTRSHECLRSALERRDMIVTESPPPPYKSATAPLAEKESLPSTEELDRKTPEMLPNGVGSLMEEEVHRPPGSPTVIVTDEDGCRVVSTARSPPPSPPAAAHV